MKRMCYWILLAAQFVSVTWLAAAADSLTVYQPPAGLEPLVPLKGYCLYTNAGKIHRPYSIMFQYVL